jgi:hypothetical protein
VLVRITANSDVRLSQRISDVADQNGYNLRDVRYDSSDGAKKALDGTHDKLAEDIKGVWSVVKSDMSIRKPLALLTTY